MTTKAGIKSTAVIGAITGAAVIWAAYILLIGPVENQIVAALLLTGGGALGALIGNANKDAFPRVHKYRDNLKLPLRKEQLDIIKKRIPTGEVRIHKEVITEEKTITLPLTREDLVIETRMVHGQNHEKKETTKPRGRFLWLHKDSNRRQIARLTAI